MKLKGFEIKEYNVYNIKEGATTSTCPICSEGRKKKSDKCMSVFWDTGLGQCNHCGERIQLHTYKTESKVKDYKRPQNDFKGNLSDLFTIPIQSHRNISKSTLERLKISQEITFMPKAKKEIDVLCFNYFLNNEIVNIKYRGANKDFKFYSGAEKIFYNLDAIRTDNECVIVEGEFDVCAFVEAGVYNVVSVPNGFNTQGNVNLDYLDNYYDYFENKEKIFIAVDNDEAGIKGKDELIRRFGAEKCWIVDFKDCKDANEYLIKHGKLELQNTIDNAQQVPLEHVETLYDFEAELDDFHINGCAKGYICNLQGLDLVYSTEFKQFTVVTGVPSSGKSEFVDSMMIGYGLNYGFKTAYASPENKPNKFHSSKLLKKISGSTPRSKADLERPKVKRAKEFINNHFYHIEFNDGYDLEKVLKKFEELVKRKGVRFFVIDPYNKIRLKSSLNKNINDYTNDYLNLIDNFVKKFDCHITLVAHPVKMKKIEGTQTFDMPTAYDIKGGGEIYDMSYHILAMVRNMENGVVSVKTLKVKFQHLGENGKYVHYKWNFNNGRYNEIEYDPAINPAPNDPIWNNDDWLSKEQDVKQLFIEAREEVMPF
tara:strand:- start:1646 stop:3436 length:1791 start_codon:yes stop_codon:yes gene_type:complete